jgi:hypothetical protein
MVESPYLTRNFGRPAVFLQADGDTWRTVRSEPMLWTIWLLLMIATPATAGVVVWWQLRQLPPPAVPTEHSDGPFPERTPAEQGVH